MTASVSYLINQFHFILIELVFKLLQVFSNPEAQMGFHPDAGASFYLSRLPGYLGDINFVQFTLCSLSLLYVCFVSVVYFCLILEIQLEF